MMLQKKNLYKLMAGVMLTVIFSVAPVTLVSATEGDTSASTKTVVTEDTTVPEVAPEKKNGWVTEESKTYYYVEDEKVTGWKTIENEKYYFDKKGVLQKSKMISKNKYVDKKGRLVDKSEIYANGKNSLTGLKKKLKKKIKGYRGTWSIYVKNLDTNEYMVINNKKMNPASVIKLYNMGTVYSQINKKKLKSSKAINSHLKSMITVSSNDSYNVLLNKVGNGSTLKGIKTVNKFCKDHGYKDTTTGGTLMPSYYPQTHSGRSLTTVRDTGHILEDIYRGNLVSESASKKMLNLLKKQERKSKIPAGLPKGVKSGNKTGECNSRQHDAAIVFSKKADYIIVVMTDGDGAAIGHIQSVSKTTYNYFNK